MPSQQQLRWSELRVGITIVVASIILLILIFLMNNATGLFNKKMTVKAYFENTAGLRAGAPVNLQGVVVGNVKSIHIVEGHGLTPVEVTLKLGGDYLKFIKKDSKVGLSSAGVLGDLFLDIDSKAAKGAPVSEGDVLQSEDRPDLNDMIKAGQGTLQNVDVLIKRVDRIVGGIENGEGSIGKVLKDPALFDRANAMLTEMQGMIDGMAKGKGSIGKLLNDDEMYRKVNASVDKLNKIVDDINAGKGNAGKLLKDEELYRNANQTVAKLNKLVDDINAGKGTLGLVAQDAEFRRKIDNIVGRLSAISERLEAGEGSAGKLLKDPSIYNNADAMLVESRNLVKAVRENPKKYLTIHMKLF